MDKVAEAMPLLKLSFLDFQEFPFANVRIFLRPLCREVESWSYLSDVYARARMLHAALSRRLYNLTIISYFRDVSFSKQQC